jgi:hypothetical protein
VELDERLAAARSAAQYQAKQLLDVQRCVAWFANTYLLIKKLDCLLSWNWKEKNVYDVLISVRVIQIFSVLINAIIGLEEIISDGSSKYQMLLELKNETTSIFYISILASSASFKFTEPGEFHFYMKAGNCSLQKCVESNCSVVHKQVSAFE